MSDLNKLKELLHYDPDTGVFTWLQGRGGVAAGSRAGSVHTNKDGYQRLCIRLGGKSYRSGRLAWFYMTGVEPVGFIDHVDRNALNDAWCNLREATPQQNACNTSLSSKNKSGVKGVMWQKNNKNWRVEVASKGKKHSCGCYKDFATASIAAQIARAFYHGEFAS